MIKCKFFTEDEFQQVGCSLQDMDEDFMKMLDKARSLAAIPFRISSAYRDKQRNKKAGGVDNSAHTRGKAVDIVCSTGSARWKIVTAAINAGFTRIGIANTFVHLDNDSELPQCVIFDYYD